MGVVIGDFKLVEGGGEVMAKVGTITKLYSTSERGGHV
jgi:hypothetical protein